MDNMYDRSCQRKGCENEALIGQTPCELCFEYYCGNHGDWQYLATPARAVWLCHFCNWICDNHPEIKIELDSDDEEEVYYSGQEKLENK